MGDVLRIWKLQEKYVEYPNFLNTLVSHYPWNVLAKFIFHENPHTLPVNSLEVDVFLPKSNARF